MSRQLNRGQSRIIGTDYQTNFPPVVHTHASKGVVKTLEISDGHYGYPSLKGVRDVGGAFVLRSTTTTHHPSENTTYWRGGANNQHYDGSFFANIDSYSRPSYTKNVDDGMAWGAEAYSKLKPTQPDFHGLNSFYELREFPELWRADYHKRGLRGVGDYNLAIRFGWAPLLNDIRNYIRLQMNAQKRIAQLLRDNGRPVRRSVSLRKDASSPVVTTGLLYSSFQPVLVTQYYVSQPRWTIRTGSFDHVWASARMRYWLPGGPKDIEYKRRLLRALAGFRVTPDEIYNSIPWTWLIDWFSNLGDLIGNLDYAGVADRLAADYVYVMRHKATYTEYLAQGKFRRQNGTTFTASASARAIAELKTRVHGGPFDLSLKEQNLSATQIGILGAIGLSRMPVWSI